MKLVITTLIASIVVLAAISAYVAITSDYNYCHSTDWPASLTDREFACLDAYL